MKSAPGHTHGRLFTIPPFFFFLIPLRLKTLRYGRLSWMSVKSSYYFSRLSSPTFTNPDANPLGTYETKMNARNAQSSISTISRKIEDCEQSTPLVLLKLLVTIFGFSRRDLMPSGKV